MSLVRSAALFNSDNHGITNTTGSYSSNSYDYAYEFNYESDLDTQTPYYDEHKMRSKLQELEKALHDDNTDSHSHSSEINGQSCPSDSNMSTTIELPISTNPHSTKALLFACAAAINSENFNEASYIIIMLRRHVSICGGPSDRIEAYMVEALASRIATSSGGLYKALKCKEPPSSDRLSAMQVLFEACPCFRFGFMAANGAILEAFENENRVHIIDFDINQGSQYYTLLQTLARNGHSNGAHVRLTGVDDPESVQRPIGGLNIIGKRLGQLAEDLGIKFEFQAVAVDPTAISPSVLGAHPGEALVVNFALQLHHLPDESVSTVNLRDRLLQMVKGMKPKLVTVVEQDLNTNTSPFMQRFVEVYNYYYAVFDSLDAALGRDSQDRMNVEKQCLARDIINVVACEGEERIERYEVAGKWRSRMRMAGFEPCPFSQYVGDEIRGLIKKYSDRYKVKEEEGALHFGWEEKTLIVSSAWR